MAATLLLLVLLGIATVTDVTRHKIYNRTTYPGIAAGMAVNLIADGWSGFQDSVAGFVVCGLIMLFCFVLFNVGGGDVKLMAMMGACLGLHDGVEAMLWTFVLGSLFGIVLLIWQIGVWRMARKTAEHLRLVWRSGGWIPLTEQERKPLKRWLFLAPSGLAAVCIVAGERLV